MSGEPLYGADRMHMQECLEQLYVALGDRVKYRRVVIEGNGKSKAERAKAAS